MTLPAIKNPTAPRATYQDVLAAPEHMIAEIINGELILSPRPALPHAWSSSGLGFSLMGPFHFGIGGGGGGAVPGGWWIIDEPELHLCDEILVPDLAGWRRVRMPHPPKAAYSTLAPDWVCEVVSPSSAGRDRVIKMDLYAHAGIVHVWLVDPQAHSLEVFRLEAARWLRVFGHVGHDKVRAEPFDAVELDTSLWWPPEEERDETLGATP